MSQLLHRTFFLPGPAGRLEALLWDVPERDEIARPPLAAVVCHPHPLFGGTMHNKVVTRWRKRCIASAFPFYVSTSVARFERGHTRRGTRGAGRCFGGARFFASKYPGRRSCLLDSASFVGWPARRLQRFAGRELIGLGCPLAIWRTRSFPTSRCVTNQSCSCLGIRCVWAAGEAAGHSREISSAREKGEQCRNYSRCRHFFADIFPRWTGQSPHAESAAPGSS